MPTKETDKAPPPDGGKRKKSSGAAKKGRNRSHKRVPMGIALRKQGIDEHTIAETWAYTLEALRGNRKAKEGDKKLLIETVKECTKHLEEDSKVYPGAPLQVRLIHNVARPQRNPLLPTAAPAIAETEPERPEPEP